MASLLQGPFAPRHDESDFVDLPLLRGRVPEDLNGVYLRNGPNPRFAPLGRYHPFDGDGMVHAVQLQAGSVCLRNRWVRTHAWQHEQANGASRYWGIRETRQALAERPLKDSGNTDLIGHRGKVLALWYLAGDAWELDPVTLDTLGRQAAIAAQGGKISAHAKVDEQCEELFFFDYGITAPHLHYGVVGRDGNLSHRVPIELPGARLPHDMAITKHYAVLHDLPLMHDPEAFALGRHKLVFRPDLPARFGVIPRFGSAAELRWFEFTPCFVYHVVNAWEEHDRRGRWITMVACRYMPTERADGSIDALATAGNIAALRMHARLWRWRMNLDTGAAEETCLDPQHNLEFPTVNHAWVGHATRYGYLADQSAREVLQFPGLRQCDLASGATLSAWRDHPTASWYSEPCFAAADGAKDEDDGYLIAFQWNAASQRQTLDIFDAHDLSLGPIAQLALPRHVPLGFHGCWMAASRLG
jgi:carotenoid cleavage dioxygenase